MAVISQSTRTFFTKYNVTATNFVYNSNASTNANAGWIRASTDRKTVHVSLATLNSNNIRYRIEGRFGSGYRPYEVYSDTIASPNIRDKVVQVIENVPELRIGFKVGRTVASPTASPCLVYAGLILEEVR